MDWSADAKCTRSDSSGDVEKEIGTTGRGGTDYSGNSGAVRGGRRAQKNNKTILLVGGAPYGRTERRTEGG